VTPNYNLQSQKNYVGGFCCELISDLNLLYQPCLNCVYQHHLTLNKLIISTYLFYIQWQFGCWSRVLNR